MTIESRGDGDICKRYRPRRFSEVVGHSSLVASLKTAIKEDNARAFLLVGDSGTGKTTIARIIAMVSNCRNLQNGDACLDCKPCKMILAGTSSDVIEMNAANARGIDDIREMCAGMSYAPMGGGKKVYILDEAHQLTKEAQNTLLKDLEEPPKHVTIILCSTEPNKLIKTLRSRCQRFNFASLSAKNLTRLLEDVSNAECRPVPAEAIAAAVEVSGGSPRVALTSLQQILQLERIDEKSVAGLFSLEDEDPEIIKLCWSLKPGVGWTEIVTKIKPLEPKGAPAIGMTCAGYFRNKLLKAKNLTDATKYSECLGYFLVPFADGKLGLNQLVHALYNSYYALNKK